MVSIKELRLECHVLVGCVYDHFSVPKHFAEVTQIGRNYIECVSDPEQGDPDEYYEKEIEGIPLQDNIQILENNGFYQSKLSSCRYIKELDISHDRIVINTTGTCTCNGKEFVDRSGVKYLHQLEACISDAGIDFKFQF